MTAKDTGSRDGRLLPIATMNIALPGLIGLSFLCVSGLVACSSEDGEPAGADEVGPLAEGSSSGAVGSGSSSGEPSTSSSSGGQSSSSSGASACSAEALEESATALDEAEAWAEAYNDNAQDGLACDSEHLPVQIAERVAEAIQACPQSQDFLASVDDAYYEVKKALSGTLALGLLQGKPFAEALVGSTIWGGRQGVYGSPYAITFVDATHVTSNECTLTEADEWVCNEVSGTYTVSETAEGAPVLTFQIADAVQTPSELTGYLDDSVDAPAFVFYGDTVVSAYTFEDACSA